MTWRTYALLGISSLWLMAPVPAEVLGYDVGTLAAVAALGALLPDLDASESSIKHLKVLGTQFKSFLVPAQVVHASEQHRGLLHSLAGLDMIGVMATPMILWIGWAPVVALLLGYASHLQADSATRTGILLLYPCRSRYDLLPKGWCITTDSLAEEVLLLPLAFVAVALLLSQLRLGLD
jgi:inner membrane protein